MSKNTCLLLACIAGAALITGMTFTEYLLADLCDFHDLDLILDTCSRTILLGEGKIVCDDETNKILYDQQLLEENGLELPLMIEGAKRRKEYEDSVH